MPRVMKTAISAQVTKAASPSARTICLAVCDASFAAFWRAIIVAFCWSASAVVSASSALRLVRVAEVIC